MSRDFRGVGGGNSKFTSLQMESSFVAWTVCVCHPKICFKTRCGCSGPSCSEKEDCGDSGFPAWNSPEILPRMSRLLNSVCVFYHQLKTRLHFLNSKPPLETKLHSIEN